MKFLEKQPSGDDKDVLVPVFKAGKEEVILLRDLCQQAYLKTPKVTELHSTRSRLRNLTNVFNQYLENEN